MMYFLVRQYIVIKVYKSYIFYMIFMQNSKQKEVLKNMRVILAPDSFKGTMTSEHVIDILKEALEEIFGSCEITKIPIADGGEGTVDSLVKVLNGKYEYVEVCNPIEETVHAKYGIVNEDTAVVEMAEASGLPLVPEHKRNPLKTTSYGTGQILKSVLDKGFQNIIVAIGGSATNDGGTGAMSALGARFLDENGNELKTNGENLIHIRDIDLSGMHPRTKECNIIVMCDVDNPILGEYGATYIYGPQKGGTEKQLLYLEEGMKNYVSVLKKKFGTDVSKIPGSGAAGGISAALMLFANAKLQSGIKIILDTIHFKEMLRETDLVVTGEGRLDGQSVRGKVLYGIGMACKEQGVPAIAVVGSIGNGGDEICNYGIRAVIPIIDAPMNLKTAMERSDELLRKAAIRAFKLIEIGTEIENEE